MVHRSNEIFERIFFDEAFILKKKKENCALVCSHSRIKYSTKGWRTCRYLSIRTGLESTKYSRAVINHNPKSVTTFVDLPSSEV